MKKTKYFEFGIIAIIILCIIYFLMLPSASLNMTNYFSFGVIGVGIAIFLYNRDFFHNLRKVKKKYYLFSIILSIIFLIMLPIEDLLKSPLLSFDEFYNATNSLMEYLNNGNLDERVVQGMYAFSIFWYILGLVGNTFLLLIYFLAGEYNSKQDVSREIRYLNWGKTRIYSYSIPIVLVTLFYMISALPVMSLPDYTSALETISSGTWHFASTLAWQYFVYLFNKLGSPFLIVFIQAFLWIYTNNYAIGVINNNAGRRGVKIYVVWSLCVTYPYMQLISPYSNSIFSSAFLGVVIATFDIIQKGAREKGANFKWIFFCAIVLFFRPEGKYIAVVIILLQIVYEYRKRIFSKKLWLLNISIFLVLNVGINYVGVAVSEKQVKEMPQYWVYGLPLSNLAGIAAYNLPMDEEDIDILEQIMPFDEWKANYLPENTDNVSKPWAAVGDRINKFDELHLGTEILRMNLKYFLKYPLYYLKIHGDAINILWKISPANYNEWSTVYVRDPNMPTEYSFLETGATTLTKNISDFAYTLPIVHSFTNRGAIYLFLLIALAIRLFFIERKVIFSLCIPLFTAMLFFFSIVVPDTRYVLPLMESGIFLFSTLLFYKKSDVET